MDADAGVDKAEDGTSKVSIENITEESDATDSGSDVDSKKKPKKEKIGFRDRKVYWDCLRLYIQIDIMLNNMSLKLSVKI